MHREKLGVVMLVALTVSAVLAGTSQAAMWNSAGIGTWAEGRSRAATAEIGATKGTLTTKLLGSTVKYTFTGLASEEGKLVQNGANAQLSGKLVFTGFTVDEPAGCKTASTLKTVSLIDTAQMGNTEATKESVYVKVVPASGEVFATVTTSGCTFAGSSQLKGSFYLKAVNPTGTAAVSQEAITSGEITSSQGGGLHFGAEKATLEGSVKVALTSGEAYSLQP